MTFSDRRYGDRQPSDHGRSPAHIYPQALEQASCPPSPPPMGRIIEMAFSGLWVIKRQGALTEVGGRLYWSDRPSLERAAAQAGIPLSDVVVHTGRLDADSR